MEMPKVTKCDIEDCAYNESGCCHALAITIGDGRNPQCDTYFRAAPKGGDAGCTAGVGACKVAACTYNDHLECQANDISVGREGEEIDCLTYQER